MKIALIGYGKMGRKIEEIAQKEGHTIVSIIDPKGPFKKITQESVGAADLCIDFSSPQAIMENIQACAALGKSLVVGTTGWQEQIAHVKNLVAEAHIGLLHSPNFSLGIYLFMRLVAAAGQLLDAFPLYDVAIIEEHHKQKIDQPSGTAHALSELLKAEMSRYKEKNLAISSVRCGSIPGTHTVIFDSPVDTIALTHTARSRQSLAEGAIAAAVWLRNKKGFFTFEDMWESRS